MSKKVFLNPQLQELRLVMDKINKKYGGNIIKTADEMKPVYKVPFDEPALDYVYGGGVPIGRITEKLGKEHTFKTVESLKAMSKFQNYCFNCNTPNALEVEWELKKGIPTVKKCKCKNCDNPKPTVQIFIDIEGTTDKEFMENFGIDTNGIIYIQPEKPSQLGNILDAVIRNAEIGLIVVDSFGATSSDFEVDNAMEDIKMNKGAVTFNLMMRKIFSAMNYVYNRNENAGITLFIINQQYQAIGSMYQQWIPQGGRGLRHGKSISTENKTSKSRVLYDKQTGEILGQWVEIINTKNKAGVPNRRAEFFINQDITSPIGYCKSDLDEQYFDFALKYGIIKKAGAWFEYNGQKKQGRDGAKELLTDEVRKLVDEKIKESYSKKQ